MASDRRVQISVNFELDLEPEEAWPDGEPETWGAAEVRDEIMKLGSLKAFLDEWDVTASGAEIDVWVDLDRAQGFLQ